MRVSFFLIFFKKICKDKEKKIMKTTKSYKKQNISMTLWVVLTFRVLYKVTVTCINYSLVTTKA